MSIVTYKAYGRNNVDNALNVGAQVPKIRAVIFTELVDLVNADPDNNGGCSLRPGYLQRYDGDVRSMFANDDIILYQEGPALKRFNPADYSSSFLNLSLDPDVDANFCDVNGLVMYSDETILRKVYEGADYGLTATTEEFKVTTPAGQVMAEFYRKLLVGVGSELCVTDPDSVDYMDSRLCRFPFGGTILMIAPVDNGVYLSTDTKIYFLAGGNQMEWSQPRNVRKVADYPAIKGTAIRMKAEKTGLEKVDGNLVMFSTEMGYCYGLNDGVLLNVTEERVRPGVFAAGTAVLREGNTGRHYLAVLRTAAGAFHGEVVNTKTQGAARYEGYDFRAVVCHKGRYFGCNANGIFEFTGKNDDGAAIQASGLSGISNCGSNTEMFFPEVHLTLRCEGEMEFSLAVDEKAPITYPVSWGEGTEGIHRKLRKLAKGVKGGQAQIGWRNVDGCDFYMQQVELGILPTNKRVR